MSDERNRGEHVVEWLDAWRTGELDPPRADRVAAHLERCEACRDALADLEAFAAAVGTGYRDLERAAPEPDWGARRVAIVERTSGHRRGGGSWLPRWAPQAAIVVVAAVAIGVLWERGVRGPDDVERALRAPSAERAADAVGPADPEASEAPPAARSEAVEEETLADGAREPEGRIEVEPLPEPAPEDFDDRARVGEAGRDEAAPEAPEPEAEARREAALDQKAAGVANAALPAHARFREFARAALADRDTLLARNALDFWADSVEPATLPEAESRRLEALADSLAAFLSGMP